MWNTVDNDDNGSLFTDSIKTTEGTLILIQGEASPRKVTYVMGSDRKGWRACFKGRGAVPVGRVHWKIVSSSGGSQSNCFVQKSAKVLKRHVVSVNPRRSPEKREGNLDQLPQSITVLGIDVGLDHSRRTTACVVVRQEWNQSIQIVREYLSLTHKESLSILPQICDEEKVDYCILDAPLLPHPQPEPPKGHIDRNGTLSYFRPHEEFVRGPSKWALREITRTNPGLLSTLTSFFNRIQVFSTWSRQGSLSPLAEIGQALRDLLVRQYPLVTQFDYVEPTGLLEGFPKAFFLPMCPLNESLNSFNKVGSGEIDEAVLKWLLIEQNEAIFWKRIGMDLQHNDYLEAILRNGDATCALSMAINGILYGRGLATVLTSRMNEPESFDFGHILMVGSEFFEPWGQKWLTEREITIKDKFPNSTIYIHNVSRFLNSKSMTLDKNSTR